MTRKKAILDETVTGHDWESLLEIIQGWIGEKCWKVAFSYGSELRLHFGARRSYAHPRLAGQKKGSWIFGTCGTSWALMTPDGRISSDGASEEELEQRVAILERSKVTSIAFSIPDNGLFIGFSNDCLLHVTPVRSDDKSGVPYWELFLPGDLFVAFGPGKSWSCRRADLPAA